MSGVSLDAAVAPLADRLVITEQQLQLYPGVPRRLNVFVRCMVAGKPCRLYFEEVTPDEENAQQTRYHDFMASQAQLKATQAALEDEKRRRAEEAASSAAQLEALNVAHQVLALQVAQTEHNARQAVQSMRDLHVETLAEFKQQLAEHAAQLDEAHMLIADLQAQPGEAVQVSQPANEAQ